MPITALNLVRHELIGLKVKVAKSTNPTQKNISGIVVDESHNTLTVETSKKEKKVIKQSSAFVFTLPNGVKVEVDGNVIVGRPEDRIKKKFPKW